MRVDDLDFGFLLWNLEGLVDIYERDLEIALKFQVSHWQEELLHKLDQIKTLVKGLQTASEGLCPVGYPWNKAELALIQEAFAELDNVA